MTADTETVAQESATQQVQPLSVLENAMKTVNVEKDQAQDLIKVFVEEALKGHLVWNKNLTNSINQAIKLIDQLVSTQISEILHHSDFQKLEGTWKGLLYLVKNTLSGPDLKIRILDVDKDTLFKNFDKAIEFDQSDLFKKVYEEEYGTAGGTPYGLLIGDYEFANKPQDIKLLQYISEVSAAAFAPFIAQAAPHMLGLETWEDLSKPSSLANIFESPEYASWIDFRRREESRFVALMLPRVLARLPYGANTVPVEGFAYEEVELTPTGQAKKNPHNKYCWMSAAYVHGAVATRAFAEYGWCTAIRGVENGGKVDGLNVHIFLSDDGDIDMECPTEIGITDRREAELSNLGFLPLSHYKNEAYAVFFGAQTTNLPKKYDDPDATSNAEIAARLPYILATSRIAHYLKVIARDKIGSFMELSNVEKWLNDWILNYINSNPDSGQALKAKYPLAAAKIEVKEVPGKPGAYNAVAWLRPWLQLEELTTSLRLVARIPQ
jgi:type VI secretion system protein ImpC